MKFMQVVASLHFPYGRRRQPLHRALKRFQESLRCSETSMIRSTAAIRGEPEPPKRSRTRSPGGKELVSIWVMSSTGFIVGWSGLRGDLGTSKTVVASVAAVPAGSAASEAALTARG